MLATHRENQLTPEIHRGLLKPGFILGATGLAAISTVNTEAEIDELGEALEETLRALRLNESV